jgi:hypothetical protein
MSNTTLVFPRVDGVDALVISGRHRAYNPMSLLGKDEVRQNKGLNCVCHSSGYGHHDPIVHGLPVGQ